MTDTKYRLAGGEPSRKWKAAAGTGLGIAAPLGLVVSYIVSRLDPAMPAEVLAAVVWLLTWLLTQGSMMLAGYVARPALADQVVVDHAATPPPDGIT